MKTIIEMAREAGIEVTYDPTETPTRAFAECWIEDLEHFAALIRADERADLYKEIHDPLVLACKKMVADEREACAKLVHDNALACDPGSMLQTYLASNAAAIRARGNT